MKRKYSPQQLDKAIHETVPGKTPAPNFERWRQEYADAFMAQQQRANRKTNNDSPTKAVVKIWRIIMKTKKFRLTAAALLIVTFSFLCWDKTAGTAWSVEKTIAAIKKLNTLHIKGNALWGPDSNPTPVTFDLWVRFPNKDSEQVKLRFECEKIIFIVQGTTAYECWPNEKVARIKQGPGIREFKFWYKAAEMSPWMTGKILETLSLFSDDWKQVEQQDPNTTKKQIVITCSYGPSNNSYSFIVDAKSKLVESAMMWDNLKMEGRPVVNTHTIIYNEDIPDTLFEVPAEMRIINQVEDEQSRALFDKGEQLFHKEKKYAEALEVYQQVYDKYPQMNIGEEALMMVGLCHRRLGQPAKEIEAYEKTVNEYPHLKGWVEATWFYLGRVYSEQGQNDKALKAFENCLKAGEEVRKSDQFPLKDAHEYIAKIKGK